MEELNKKQELAVKRFKRALKALYDADVFICGMDNDIIYATSESCENARDMWVGDQYPSPAMAHKEGGDHAGIVRSPCYRGSGGW